MARDQGTLAGELGLISLFDIGQLLLLNRATGVMNVTSEGRRGSLWFRDGQLVNAIDEKQHDGEDAAFAVFTWRRGRFEFHGGPLPGVATIEGGTEAIMLEAARRIDETGPDSGSESVGSETAKLVAHQSRFDLLREEFTRVTRDVSSATRGTPASEDAWLDALQSPGDRLLLRPGSVARIQTGGVWRALDGFEAPIDETDYAAFKTHMLASESTVWGAVSARPVPGTSAAPLTARISHRGLALTIQVIAGEPECLWLSAVRPANLAAVHGPFELVDAFFAAPGLLLAAAPDAVAAHALLAAVVARFSRLRGVTTLMVTDDPALAPVESTGVVIATPFAAYWTVAATTQPGALAIDAREPIDDRLLTACATVPHVLCAVVAADAESVIPRWLVRFPAFETARARMFVASTPVAIALAEHAPDGSVRFTVQRVSRAGRPAVDHPAV